MTKRIFLLGGYDLEMLTIRSLLEQHLEVFYDKELRWDNAWLSQYAEQLEQFGDNAAYDIYGIELIEKNVDIPQNYHRLDHHNDYSQLPASIEQVASLLNVTLTKEQQLIAANDKGYIPAMIALEAGDEEIAQIRKADRHAQGVTASDERLAEKAVEERQTVGGIIIVGSETSRFSPIADRLYPYERLLIYTSEELMYYGEGKSRLAELYVKEIDEGRMFHGGSDNGYIGTVRAVYSESEILKLKDKIVKQINQ
jgi:hypothetical protein